MKDERGVAAAVGALVVFSMIFACYLAYSVFNAPVTQVIDTVDEVDDDNTIPGGILPNLESNWAIWPIIMIVLTILIVVAYGHRRDTGYGY